MKRLSLKKDWGLKLVALILSGALWLYVKSLEEPMTELVFSIPLRISGRSNDIRVTDMPETISATVSIPTTELVNVDRTKLQAETKAFVDVSSPRIGIAEYRVDFFPSAQAKKYGWLYDSRVSIMTEEVARKNFVVEIVPTGAAPVGLEYANASVDPESVIVESGSTMMNQVAKVRVLLNLETTQSGKSQELQLEVLDSANRPLSEAEFKVSPSKVKVTPALAPGQPRRNLVVSPIWTGQTPLGFRVADARIEPVAITVVGDRDRLRGLAVIETEPISLDGLTQNTIRTIKLKVPAGVKIQGKDTVTVRLTIHESVAPPPTP